MEESRISGIMEGIERYSSEIHDRKVRLDTFEMIEGREPAVNPEDLILPEDTDTGHVLPWVEGWDIANDKPVLVPAQAVFHPLPRNSGRSSGLQRTALPRGTPGRRRSSMRSAR